MLEWREAGAGHPVVLLHAYPFSSSMWEAQLAGVPAGWRTIAPDLAGFGRSGPRAGVTSIDGYASDVIELLDHLELESAVFCGASMGGYVTLAIHRRYAERVRALVLCDTRAEADTDAGRINRLNLARSIRAEGSQALVDALLQKMVSRMTRLANPALMSELEKWMREASPEAAAAAQAAMAHRADATPELRDVSVPTLVVVGSEDEITTPGEAQMMVRAIRGSRIEQIEGAGHLPSLERPEHFNTILKTFLLSLPV